MLVTANLSTGSRAPSHPSNTPTAHCHFLLFPHAFITKLNTKRQQQRIKISVRPPPSPNFLPLSFFILTGSHLFPQLVGSVTTETSLAALSQNSISKEFRLVQRSRRDRSIPGASPPHSRRDRSRGVPSRCDRGVPGVSPRGASPPAPKTRRHRDAEGRNRRLS